MDENAVGSNLPWAWFCLNIYNEKISHSIESDHFWEWIQSLCFSKVSEFNDWSSWWSTYLFLEWLEENRSISAVSEYFGWTTMSGMDPPKHALFTPSMPDPRLINNRRTYDKISRGKCAYTCLHGLPDNSCEGFFFKDTEVTNCIQIFQKPVNVSADSWLTDMKNVCWKGCVWYHLRRIRSVIYECCHLKIASYQYYYNSKVEMLMIIMDGWNDSVSKNILRCVRNIYHIYT